MSGELLTRRDRFEGSATWFGITDYKGRKKSVYYALQNTWKNGHAEIPKSNMFIIGPDFKVMSGTEYIYSMVNHDPAYKNIEWKMYSTDYAREIKIEKTQTIFRPPSVCRISRGITGYMFMLGMTMDG